MSVRGKEAAVATVSSRTGAVEVAVEEPLEIRIDGTPVAVVMRTPGDDFELACGFVHTEGLVDATAEVAGVSYCRETAGGRAATNVVSVATEGEVGRARVAERRRLVVASSACGLCGRRRLEEVRRDLPPLSRAWRPDPAAVQATMRGLEAGQSLFRRTGCTHAAGVFDEAGRSLALFEDVGRHNAVDKCIGALALRGRLPLSRCLLAVSGRVSFEIVQKALSAGIPWIAAVGGPTHLALDLARVSGLGLFCWVREGRATVFD